MNDDDVAQQRKVVLNGLREVERRFSEESARHSAANCTDSRGVVAIGRAVHLRSVGSTELLFCAQTVGVAMR